jgi:HAD superfamily hydrolase (TIGR01509 family)
MRPDLAALLHERTCFLFDLDGTLVDSNPCHERAYLQALRPRAPELAARFSYELCKGRRTRDALRMFGVEDDAVVDELTEAKQAAYRELVASGAILLLPHAHEILTLLRERGKRLFLVTGGSRRSTAAVLGSLGITAWFEHIVTADDVERGKPAPDCWLECMERGAIDPADALAIEDAISGILAARAAGLDGIAVNNPELAELPEYAGTLENIAAALKQHCPPGLTRKPDRQRI